MDIIIVTALATNIFIFSIYRIIFGYPLVSFIMFSFLAYQGYLLREL